MTDQPTRQVRRIAPAATHGYDYADAFEFRLTTPDTHPPEAWVRAGLGTTPKLVKRLVSLLGLRPASLSQADHVGSFRIIESGPDLIHLETNLPLMRVVLVGRRPEPTLRTLTTMLHFERPVLARLIWAVLGVGHRRTVPRLLTSGLPTS